MHLFILCNGNASLTLWFRLNGNTNIGTEKGKKGREVPRLREERQRGIGRNYATGYNSTCSQTDRQIAEWLCTPVQTMQRAVRWTRIVLIWIRFLG